MTTFPEPDKGEVRRFAETAFRDATPGTYIAARLFSDDSHRAYRSDMWEMIRIEGDGLDDVVSQVCQLAHLAAAAGTSVTFAAPVCTFLDPGNAKEANIADGVALAVECDERPLQCWERLADHFGLPTIVVASGGEWTNSKTGEVQPKLHLYWVLDAPARGLERLTRLREVRRVACALVQGDASGVPVQHPYRWPGTWHTKSTPRLARVVEFAADRRYSLNALFDRAREVEQAMLAAAGAKSKPKRRRAPKGNDPATAAVGDVIAAIARIPNDDLPWKSWHRIGMATHAATGDSEAGCQAFHDWSARSGKYDENYTDQVWDDLTFSPPSRIGYGTLFFEARKTDPNFRKPSDIAREAPLEAYTEERPQEPIIQPTAVACSATPDVDA